MTENGEVVALCYDEECEDSRVSIIKVSSDGEKISFPKEFSLSEVNEWYEANDH